MSASIIGILIDECVGGDMYISVVKVKMSKSGRYIHVK